MHCKSFVSRTTYHLFHSGPVAPGTSRLSTSLKLLRAILRECRRLPDPAARDHCVQRALDRYRRHKSSHATEVQVTARIAQARKSLGLIQRANDGERIPLLKILMHTYGRNGPRRRVLLDELRHTETPFDYTSPQQNLDTPNRTRAMDPGKKISSACMALAESQRVNQPPSIVRDKLRRIKPKIPEYNVWGRKMPKRRIKNMWKRFRAEMLDKLLPPLPAGEWTRLKDLASGKIREPRLMSNRSDTSTPEAGFDKQELSRHGAEALLLGLTSSENLRRRDVGNPHNITDRFMKRLWAEVFSQCPVMRWDETASRWDVKWGVKEDKDRFVRASHAEDQALFDRLDVENKQREEREAREVIDAKARKVARADRLAKLREETASQQDPL
ncbi:MAG: hypothetical protein M4579_003799 [Chaenotheca gracillima]|nr:MAG: hypothetical protein M4579_003799 [Chaenotheca gracillima]